MNRSTWKTALALLTTASIAACSTPLAPRYHTLLSTAVPAAVPSVAPLGAGWELLPVTVPAQVSQPQFAVRGADGTMALLEGEVWIAPLAEEFRAALGERLTRALGERQGLRGVAQQRSGWRVRVEVKRFDLMPGSGIRLDAQWALLAANDERLPLVCQTTIERSVADGYPALSAGQRDALATMADEIAATLRRSLASTGAACPAP